MERGLEQVCFRWGQEEMKMKRSEVKGLQDTKKHLEVLLVQDGFSLNRKSQE